MLINNKVKKEIKAKERRRPKYFGRAITSKEISRTYCTSPTLVIWDTIAGIS